VDRATAIQFLTTKVAQIIHDTVSCNLAERSESDWLAAERLVNEHFTSVIPLMLKPGVLFYTDHRGTNRQSLPESCSYVDFDRVMGLVVWTQTQPLRRYLPSPPYGMITFY
jgi:hypothetical protein